MICKWCGAVVDVKAHKCPICKKEIPPVSDCGGFYDVAPQASLQAAVDAPSSPPPAEAISSEEAPPAAAAAPRKRGGIIALIAAFVLLAGVAALAVLQFFRINELKDAQDLAEASAEALQQTCDGMAAKLEEAEGRIAALEAQKPPKIEYPPAEEPPAEEPPTEAPPAEEPSSEEPQQEKDLLEQALSFSISQKEDGTVDMPSSPAGASIETDEGATACSLDGKQLWKVTLEELPAAGTEESGSRVFEFRWEIYAEELGIHENPEITWEYLPADGKQEALPVDMIENAIEDGKSTLTLSGEWLKAHAPDGALELVCILDSENAVGGRLTISCGIRSAAAPKQKEAQ